MENDHGYYLNRLLQMLTPTVPTEVHIYLQRDSGSSYYSRD